MELSVEKPNIKNEILSGLTVALALVPEAIGFSFIAGVNPLVGLYTAVFLGLISSLIGGRPGMISGATGPMAVIVVGIVADYGLEHLFAAVILAGVLQTLAGIFKLGKFVRLIPKSVIIGFLNGLAIVLFKAQLPQFKTESGAWLQGLDLFIMVALIALTMAIIKYFPKLTKAVPASLIAILVPTLIVVVLGLETKTVKDLADISGGFPAMRLPNLPFNLDTLKVILPTAIILANAGLINTLMAMSVLDEMTDTRGNANRICVGQGVANIFVGLFGGMGGCSMMGQSIININSGGRKNLSGITAALFLLSFIMVASPIIGMIPIATLVGVMFMVVIGTFKWSSLKMFGRMPKVDIFVMLMVMVVMIFSNLAYAVIVGVILSALAFAWEKGQRIDARVSEEEGVKYYHLDGPLFFGSTISFMDVFNVKKDPAKVIIDFQNSQVMDHSAIEAINMITEKYRNANKEIHLKHLSKDCFHLLKNAEELIDINVMEDPTYHVADDILD